MRFDPTGGGRFGVFAEFSREDGGHQLVRSSVEVPGAPAPPTPSVGPGPRAVARAMVATIVADDAVVGRPTRIRMALSAGGRPVTDAQAWLGMAGHLFVLGTPPGA